MFTLRSKIDNKDYKVNQNIIDASVLLKNICELTTVNESIVVDCSSICLETFIKLINHYENIEKDEHDTEFENELFKDFDDTKLVELVKEMCIIDSDFFLDSVADLILARIRGMKWKQMQEYFELEDDFTSSEREFIEKYPLEYFLSINTEFVGLNFPIYGTNFTKMKNKFYSPMNALFARIIQRSNSFAAFQLSMINKTLKKENDRHPIKVSFFQGGRRWIINFSGSKFFLTAEEYDEKYFDIIKTRKMIVYDRSIDLRYDSQTSVTDGILRCSSLNFIIPNRNQTLKIIFAHNKEQIHYFDIRECPFTSIQYEIRQIPLNFDEFYLKLIAKDLSKKIQIRARESFKFFSSDSRMTITSLRIEKKPNASKFYEIYVVDETSPLPAFKDFLLKYMDDNSIILSTTKLFNISNSYNRKESVHIFEVSDAIDSFNENQNIIQEYCKCKTGCRRNTNCKCRKLKRICNSRCHNNINNNCTNMDETNGNIL